MLAPVPKGKCYNFFIDDNVFFFTDIYRHSFRSIFDNFYLANLKKAHEAYGTKFTLNSFYHNHHEPDFDLSLFPDRYRSEFEDNAEWLRFAFHAQSEYPECPYSKAHPEKLPEHYAQWKNAMKRIVGEKCLTAPIIMHFFSVTDDCRRFMREHGMKFFAVREGKCIEYNPAFDSYDIPVDIILNLYKGDIDGIRAKLMEKVSAGQEKILIGSHEQYAYKHYVNYIPEYFDGLNAACRVMVENGYKCEYFNSLV